MNSDILKNIDALLRRNPLANTLNYIKNKASIDTQGAPFEFRQAFFACRAILAGGNDHRNGFDFKYVDEAFTKYFDFDDPIQKDNNIINWQIRTMYEQFIFNICDAYVYTIPMN